MNNTNPQIDEQLQKLAELCCNALDANADSEIELSETTEQLLKSLLMSGYARKGDASLQADIEARVKDSCREPAMHRGGALSSLTEKLQKKFDDLVRWESRQPDEHTDPKAANISSATDA
ncbi:MAG: hypothetical protein HKN47_27310 [Pirellulaceae bacterium]|nr:hypothetical protein [Pirellulaceae bacterium]